MKIQGLVPRTRKLAEQIRRLFSSPKLGNRKSSSLYIRAYLLLGIVCY
nr:MAG TPA: hypothetical protein [Caudoviricetes sp.]